MYKILIVEDVQVVADLQILMLIRAGIAFESRRVETAEDFTRQIELAAPDAILYSASMPHFSGFVASAKAQSLCPDTPLIFVSGTHSEETAAETRKRATTDRVYTTTLAELASTFDRAIKESEERKKKKAQESAITHLSRMYADQTRELEQLHVQHVTLRNLSRYLRASVTPAEVYATLECFGPQLFRDANGKLYLVHLPGKHLAALANLKARDSLHEQSVRDSLTGLYNRRFLEEFLLRELARADRKKHPLSIITMDIDHFKRINDTLGHGAGDIVLRRVGLLLQGFVRQSDIACRVGGEEFSVLLPEASMQIATQRAENIRRAVQELKLNYEEHTLAAITISLGVAAFPDHGTTPAALLHAADQALYDAKYRGRDRVESA